MYQGFMLQITTVRDPVSKLVKHLCPTIILNTLAICIYQVNPTQITDRLTSVAMLFLSFEHIYKCMVSDIPEVPIMTLADKYFAL